MEKKACIRKIFSRPFSFRARFPILPAAEILRVWALGFLGSKTLVFLLFDPSFQVGKLTCSWSYFFVFSGLKIALTATKKPPSLSFPIKNQ